MKSDSTIAFMRLNETLYEDKGGYDNNSRECLEVVDSDWGRFSFQYDLLKKTQAL